MTPIPQESTSWELIFHLLLPVSFIGVAIVAARRILVPIESHSKTASDIHQNENNHASTGENFPAKTNDVLTLLCELVMLTSVLRAIWLVIPKAVRQPNAQRGGAKRAASALCCHVLEWGGSLALLSIFIMMLVHWSDILKKRFSPNERRLTPMTNFLRSVTTLAVLEILNVLLFLLGLYATEGMILYNSFVLAVVCIICVYQMTNFSHHLRVVLKSLGAINKSTTDAQVQRIVWITVSSNLFLVSRALLEFVFAVFLIGRCVVTNTNHSVTAKPISHVVWWDNFALVKYSSELAVLGLLLYVLRLRSNHSDD